MTYNSDLSRRFKANLILCLFFVFTGFEAFTLSSPETFDLHSVSYFGTADVEAIVLRNPCAEGFNWFPVSKVVQSEGKRPAYSYFINLKDGFQLFNLSFSAYQRNVFYVYVSSLAP